MNSIEHKNKLESHLEEILNYLDDTYNCMRDELEKEILDKKEHIEKIDKETNEIYKLLTKEQCIKLIEGILPLRIKLFNKINWLGKGIVSNGRISVRFYFNEKVSHNFEHEFSIMEIKKLLKFTLLFSE